MTDKNDAVERLKAAARELSREEMVNREFSPEMLDDPQWSAGQEWRRDWRYYVPQAIQVVWCALPLEARLVAYINATETAVHSEFYDPL